MYKVVTYNFNLAENLCLLQDLTYVNFIIIIMHVNTRLLFIYLKINTLLKLFAINK